MQWHEQKLLVQPRNPKDRFRFACKTFTLPKISSSLLERMGGIARAFWRRYQRSLTILLYLNIKSQDWRALVPPQIVSPNAVRCDCCFAGFEPPGEAYRLAGSLRSLPCDSTEDARSTVSPIDGFHLVMDPQRRWLSVLAFLCIEGVVLPAAADQVVSDDYAPQINALLPRISWADEL